MAKSSDAAPRLCEDNLGCIGEGGADWSLVWPTVLIETGENGTTDDEVDFGMRIEVNFL